MATSRRIDRRVFLSGAGRVGLALMLSGATASCATDAAEVSDGGTPTPGSQSGAAQPSTTPSGAAPSDPSGRVFDWQRIDLGFVSAYLLIADTQVVVVDTGVEGSDADIERALTDLGMGWYAVEHVIVTHKHPDHAGSATAILEATEAQVHAGQGDHLSIVGSREVAVVDDGDDVFGLQIVATPGHTPGHISVFDPVGRVMVAGDALVGRGDGGGVAGPDAAYTQDMATAEDSVRKLATFDYDTLLFGHGEPVEQDAATLVRRLADGLASATAPSPGAAPTGAAT